jgi:hypothetical protein
MDESPTRSERERRVEEIDARTDAPNVRAERIWQTLKRHAPNETNWDVLCFAVEFIGMLVHEFPWLEVVAKPLATRFYTAHYAKEGLYDGPRRSDEVAVEHEHRRPNMGGEQKENSSGIVLASGIFGRRSTEPEVGLHVSDNRDKPSEGGSSETARSNERGDSGSNEG